MFKIYLRCYLCGKHIGYLKTDHQFLLDDGKQIEFISGLVTENEDHIQVMCEDCVKIMEETEKANAAKYLAFECGTQPVRAGNKVNLCDTCRHTYPDCGQTDVLFGDGIGNDNICCCGKYKV